MRTRNPLEDWILLLRPDRAAPLLLGRFASLGVLLLGSWALPLAAWAQPAVSGTVVDAFGAPLRGVVVTLTDGRSARHAKTDESGRFRVRKLQQGVYQVTWALQGFAPAALEGVAISGAPTDLGETTLRLVEPNPTSVVTVSPNRPTPAIDAPASVSVIPGPEIRVEPAMNYGDLLRSLPGVNVIQLSLRDIDVTSREASTSLANSELVLLDGRPVNLDSGVVLWDLIPVDSSEIQQIEVLRGPASAAWGNNALNGVVNIVTKPTRPAEGGTATIIGGEFSRDGSRTAGLKGEDLGGNVVYSHTASDVWSYRVSGGYFFSDGLPRPTVPIPISHNPLDPQEIDGGAPYQAFQNPETRQPRFSLRADEELGGGARITYDAGYARTSGTIHTGDGPFFLLDKSSSTFGRMAFSKGDLRVAWYVNSVDTQSTGNDLDLKYKSQTFSFEAQNTNRLGSHDVLSYGGSARHGNFTLALAPATPDRSEYGAWMNDEVAVGGLRLGAGGRVDKIQTLSRAVLSPRGSVLYKVASGHSLWGSFSRGFREPSFLDDYLNTTSALTVDLSSLASLVPARYQGQTPSAFPLVVGSLGSEVLQAQSPGGPALREEVNQAWEVGYRGSVGSRTAFEVVAYRNDHEHAIRLVTDPVLENSLGVPGAYYTAANPPPNWDLPSRFVNVLQREGIYMPATFTFLNLGPYRNKGIEASLSHVFRPSLTGFVNYTYQAKPEILPAAVPIPASMLSTPPANRYNLGLSYSGSRFFGNMVVNHADKAFWSDILSEPYHGFTAGYNTVNLTVGRKWGQGKYTASLRSTNLNNNFMQQHIYGDIIKRQVWAELKMRF